ncbi:MAG: MBL fold metallo-hydrolase [Thalassobaculales bacterium]
MSVRLHFHGAAGCVTGACFRITSEAAEVLVDCGLFQGSKTLKELNYQPFPFAPRQLDAVLLTHAHIDHSGQIPRLHRAGFDGEVFATPATRELCAVLLPDAGGIQEAEVEQLNRRQQRRGRATVTPIYTRADAEACMAAFRVVPLGDWVTVAAGMRARWWNAGHILGSASIELEVERPGGEALRLCFSGDIGPGDRDFAADPEGPANLDHVIVEATYGGSERPSLDRRSRRALLAREVTAAHAAGGPLVIPAFAVERTQELLVDLLAIMDEGLAPDCHIYLDSPLAIRASEVFLRQGGGSGGGANPFAALAGRRHLRTTESVDESRSLERLRGWHIIMAGSGMCDAGRIRHHLKRLLWRPEATVLLSGFQAIGTLGRLLQDGARQVKIQGEDVRVRARIRALDVYSGHADAAGLAAWVAARGRIAGNIFITHGEPDSARALAARLAQEGRDPARLRRPEIDDSYTLDHGPARRRPAAARIQPGAAGALDWHNARAAFLLELDEALRAGGDDAARAALLSDLRGRLKTP